MTAPRIDHLTAPAEVGRQYSVPCVRCAWLTDEPEYWPVTGPLHADVEFLRFDRHHYHCDARFLSAEQWDRAFRTLGSDDVPGTAALATTVIHGLEEIHWRDLRCRRHYRFPLPLPGLELNGFRELQSAYADKHLLGARKLCPHRGAALASIPPDAAGCVVCPLHGLRFHCATGRLVPHGDLP
jgi:hypothetical protein